VNVLYGSVAGLVTDTVTVLSQDGPIPGAPEMFDSFGNALVAGDFNGDGVDDLAIGVPSEGLRASQLKVAGMVNVVYGTLGVGLTTEGSQGFSQLGPIRGRAEEGDRFGTVLAAGDFDGDGDDDLAVGVPNEGLGGRAHAGAVNIILGSPGTGLTNKGNFMISQKGQVRGIAEEGDQFVQQRPL